MRFIRIRDILIYDYDTQSLLTGTKRKGLSFILFSSINEEIALARERYHALMEAPEHIEEQLQDGAEKARAICTPFMQEIRESVGISRITK